MEHHSQRGSAILMILIGIVLFAALGYAFMRNTTGSTAMMTNEAAKAAATELASCANAVQMATKRLQLRGCGTYLSLDPDGTNIIPGAPADGSCSVFHVNGGGVNQCGSNTTDCMRSLAIGASCNGVIYAGISGGNRIYAAMTDESGPYFTWNNGNNPVQTATPPGGASTSDGLSNTDLLVAVTGDPDAPYLAAIRCRTRGSKWYLPAQNELQLLYDNRNIGSFSGTYNIDTTSAGIFSRYWSSTRTGTTNAFRMTFSSGNMAGQQKYQGLRIRCVRSD